ncbi:MAG: glutathione S-transferase family protein [Stellaceae bacterium]
MADTILYGLHASPYVRAARLGLEEKGVAYDLVEFPVSEIKAQPHLSRQPFGRIPAFEHKGFPLYETQAILRYVDAAFPGPALQRTDPREAARMNQIMGIVDAYMFMDVSFGISYQRLMAPKHGKAPDEARVKDSLPKARLCIEALDGLKGDNVFMAGEAVSLADLMVAPHYHYFSLTPEGRDILGPHERLRRWWQAMAPRESIKKTEPRPG